MRNRMREFLSLGVIIGSLPNNIQDGQVIDAVPVMANFNYIVNQVNANIPPLIPSIGSTPIYVALANVGGTPNAITLTPTVVNPGYVAGQRYSFPPTASNTGAVTIATSGLAPRALTLGDGTPLTGGELLAAGIVDIQDNGTNYILLNSAQGSGLVAFTPTISFGGASVGITYSVQVGQYIKIGRVVHFNAYIVLTSKGSSVGIASLKGLPFTVNAGMVGAGVLPSIVCEMSNCAFGANSYVGAAAQPGQTFLDFVITGNSASVNFVNDGGFANNSQVAVGGFYFT